MASAQLTTTVIIRGKDDASAAIDKSTKSAKGLGGALDDAASRASGLTSALRQVATGDVRGGMAALQGSLGGIGGAALTATAGIAGIAVAIGAAAIKATEWSIELERLRAQMRFAFGPEGEQRALAVAEAIGGVGVESVVKLQATMRAAGVDAALTTEQLQRITAAATTLGKTGDDALAAFADAIRSGSADALKGVGIAINGEVAIKRYAEANGLSAERLTAAQRSQAILNATMAQLPSIAQAGTDAYARQDEALSTLGNSWVALKLELSSIISGPMVRVVEAINSIGSSLSEMGVTAERAVRVVTAGLRTFADGIGLAADAGAALADGRIADAIKLAGAAAETANPAVFAARSAMHIYAAATDDASSAQAAAAATIAATTEVITAQSGQVGGLVTALAMMEQQAGKIFDAAAKRGAARPQRARAAGGRDAQRDAARRQAAAFARELAEAEADQRAANIELIRREIDAEQERAAAIVAAQDRVRAAQLAMVTDPAERLRLEQMQVELERRRALTEAQERYYLDGQLLAQQTAAIEAEAAARTQALQRQAIDLARQERAAKVDAALSIAQASVAGLEQVGIAERAAAGLKALLAGAEAALLFARGQIPQALSASFAAVQYARAALQPAPTQGALGAATGQRQIAEPAPSRAVATSTVININGVYATKAQVGAALSSALKAAQPTGMAA